MKGKENKMSTTPSLSCGSNQRVFIIRRSTGMVVAELQPLDGSFTRTIDVTSTASVSISSQSYADCCEDGPISTLQMSLSWWRDDEEVWVGPITYISWSADEVRIEASDLTFWWGRKIAPTIDHRTGAEATEIVKAYHNAAAAREAIRDFDPLYYPTGNTISRVVYAKENRYIGDLIDEIAKTSVDIVAIGRSVYVGAVDTMFPMVFDYTDDDFFFPPLVEMRGPAQGFCTAILAVGSKTKNTYYLKNDAMVAIFGLIERVIDLPAVISSDLRKAAQTYLDFHSNPFFISAASTTTLATDSSIPFNFLIPGIKVRVTLRRSCNPISTTVRIQNITNNLNGEVQISFQPVGTEAFLNI